MVNKQGLKNILPPTKPVEFVSVIGKPRGQGNCGTMSHWRNKQFAFGNGSERYKLHGAEVESR